MQASQFVYMCIAEDEKHDKVVLASNNDLVAALDKAKTIEKYAIII